MTPEGELKPAIVVSGASSGIGRELARLAAGEGAFVLLIGRSAAALSELAADLETAGAKTAALSVDLRDRHAGDEIESALSARGLYCDVLVNSAGYGLFGRAAEIGRAEQLDLLDVNARALTELTLRFLPGMVARRRGGILNVGSITGYVPGPNMAIYYAAKSYVRLFTLALAAETAGTGVTVSCLCPGQVRTAFFERCTVGKTRLSKLMPRSNAAATAAAGWRGFKAGRRLVIPRPMDRFISAMAVLMPETLMLRVVAALQRAPAHRAERAAQ